MPNKLIQGLAAAAVLATVSLALAAKKQELPEVTEDGLHLVPDSKLAVVYAEPGASLSGYSRVLLLDAYVAFRKNWERDQRRSSAQPFAVTSSDVEKMRTTLASEFQQVFTETLEAAGYPVVDAAGDDVLLLRPAIINLDVAAPDTMHAGRSKTYTDSAGEMTLYIELYDSVTGDLMAKAIDRKVDRTFNGFYTWTNATTNKAAAIRILKGWADILVNALNEAHANTASGTEPSGNSN